jgi:hypothetical protein
LSHVCPSTSLPLPPCRALPSVGKVAVPLASAPTPLRRRSPVLHLTAQVAAEPRVSERRRSQPSTPSVPLPSRHCLWGPLPLCRIVTSPSACQSHAVVPKAGVARERAQHAGYGLGCLLAPGACPWAARPVQASRPAQVASMHAWHCASRPRRRSASRPRECCATGPQADSTH